MQESQAVVTTRELWLSVGTVSVIGMGESLLQQQLDEVRDLLARARELFGPDPLSPPPALAGEAAD